jgi:hypothetical protein
MNGGAETISSSSLVLNYLAKTTIALAQALEFEAGSVSFQEESPTELQTKIKRNEIIDFPS